ncbi:MAG TPA: glycosyltransferase [Casimicrobiaceae bacterium]|nr:glycosyltransferase [Casimicrobiaceae bacterium]
MRPVDVIVPVRRSAGLAARCVASVLASRNAQPCEVIVVGDADALRGFSAALAAGSQQVTVSRQDRSLDYAGLLNRAFAQHDDRDVVVLQADAEVEGNWLDRLVAHGRIRGIGIVGTFTNVAGSATYPQPDARNPLPEGCTLESLDALFERANAGVAANVPALFGPCLHITRACIDAVGEAKTVATEDGHATEIDFALRARMAGFASRVAGDVFVRNDGEGSFGERAMRVETHAATPTLAHLHPEIVDPVRAAAASPDVRMLAGRVDLTRLAASARPAIVFVSHAWGGGIRRHMDDLAALVAGRADVLYLEPANADTVRLHWPRTGERFEAWFRLPGDLPALAATLRAIGVVRLHFHHVHGLPRAILQLPVECGVPYDCTLHDYYAICPQYHLADEAGRYCGEPDEAGCAACIRGRPVQWNMDIRTWRATFATFLRGAARVIAPSRDVAERIGRHVTGVAIAVWPHPERPLAMPASPVRVVTLGNLSAEKGLAVVAQCAEDVKRRGLPLVFRVLGATTAPIAQSPDAPLMVHGSYDENALPRLLAAERANVLFFPAQVPETYSYTLSVALATRTPIVASALGAFPERLAGRPGTRLVPWDATPAEWNAALLDAASTASRVESASATAPGVPAGATS